MNKPLGKVIVAIWFILAIICFSFGVIETVKSGFGKSYPFFILAILAFAMFQFRKMMHKKLSK